MSEVEDIEVDPRTTGSRERLQRDAQTQKDAIAGTLKLLDQRVQRATDWRTHVSDHPVLSVGIALGVGVLCSRIVRRRPTPQERIIDAVAESIEGVADSVHDRLVSRFSGSVLGGVLKAAAGAYVTKVAAAYVRERTVENSSRAVDLEQ